MMDELSGLTLAELWQLFPIRIEKYNPEYPLWYEEEKSLILGKILPDEIFRISHIGSTAVPGLAGKPTVDILLEIHENADPEKISADLKTLGWRLMAVNNVPFRLSFNKGYTPQGFAERVFHLHLRHPGDCDELYFRDYLMQHPETQAAYTDLKYSLKKEFEHDRDGYTAAKSEFVLKYTSLSKEEAQGAYSPK